MRRRRLEGVLALALVVALSGGGLAGLLSGCRPAGGQEAVGPAPAGIAAPLVCVTESRKHICASEEYGAESPELVAPNGGVVLVGFGDVAVKVRVSAQAKDEDLLSAVSASPAATSFVALDLSVGESPS